MITAIFMLATKDAVTPKESGDNDHKGLSLSMTIILIVGIALAMGFGKVMLSKSNLFKSEAQIEHESCVKQTGNANMC
ncbi:hypothetical protein AAFX28_15100 [Vibrio sp. TBV020]